MSKHALRINPFPDYPVSTLAHATVDTAPAVTVTTPGIRSASRSVGAALAAVEANRAFDGLNVAVQGDFGTGKTHLLRYAAHQLTVEASRLERPASIIAVSAAETSPGEWYRSTIGPCVATLDLQEIVLQLFARAAEQVALQAPLTQGVASLLRENPQAARSLVHDQLLNPTAVEIAFHDELIGLAPEIATVVRRALTLLVWSPDEALRWLGGETITPEEQATTGLSSTASTDELAGDVLVAIAGAHARLGRPFMLAIDELEHLTATPDQALSRRNLTWLKRLLERLKGAGALVFVAGHESAWDARRDYFDRFSPGAAIRLERLTGAEVWEITERHVDDVGQFTPANAAQVAELSGGSIRAVLTLLRRLYDVTSGFQSAVEEDDIRRVVLEVAQPTPSATTMEEGFQEVLREAGLDVGHDVSVEGVRFDMAAFQDGRPVVLFEVKQAAYGSLQHDQAQRFLDKLRAVREHQPECIGAFVAANGVDPGLARIDPSLARVLWLDGTDPQAPELVGRALHAAREGSPASASRWRRSSDAAPDAAMEELLTEIQVLKDEQSSLYEQLEVRLAPDPGGLAFSAPSPGDTRDARRALYEELSRRPSVLQRLGLTYGGSSLSLFVALGLGIALVILSSTIAEAIARGSGDDDYSSVFAIVRVTFVIVGILLCAAVVTATMRRYVIVDRFYTFRQSCLRDVYVRELPLDALIGVNAILERSLNRYGPLDGLEVAEAELADAHILSPLP